MPRIPISIAIGFAALMVGTAAPGIDDPTNPTTLIWSTLLGGQQSEKGLSMVADSAGNLLVTGRTRSADFPTTVGSYDTTHGGMNDVFVAKLDPSGTTLIWSTLLGGTGDDVIPTITVDAADNPVLTGTTTSSDFPVTAGAYDTTNNGMRDSWIAKLDATGSELIWSTYWGGSNNEVSNRVLIDPDGCPIVVGYTLSADLPMTAEAHDPQFNGGWDAYVGRFSPDGSQLLAATYLGSPGDDIGNGLALDQSGNAVVVGEAGADGFPTTPGAFSTENAGGVDTFVSKLDLSDATLLWSTVLGGVDNDIGVNVLLDATNRPIVTGSTASSDFPTTDGVFDSVYNGGRDTFVSTFDTDGGALVWSTFLGGSGVDKGWALAVDPAGQTVAIGTTNSPDLPTTTNAFDPTYNGANDVFIARLDDSGAALGFCTYLGGDGVDEAYSTVMSGVGHLLLIGVSASTDFPTTPGSFQESAAGLGDAFVAEFDLPAPEPAGVPAVVARASLRSIHPNPFNPMTTVAFTTPARGVVRLEVYDVGGRRVRTLVDSNLDAGDHTVCWDGRDDAGWILPAGQYLARLTAGTLVQVSKMTLVK